MSVVDLLFIVALVIFVLALLAAIQYMLLYTYWSKRTAAVNARVRGDEGAERKHLRRAFRARWWAWPTRAIEPAERAHDRMLRTEKRNA
jgi:hypothetical protein